MAIHNRLMFPLLTLFLLGSKPATALETPELYVANFAVTPTASGVPISVAGKIYISVNMTLHESPVLRIHALADLADLQRKIPAIVSTIKLPSENCRSFSANNPIVSLSNTKLSFVAGQAVFHTDGDVAVWDCRENPIPNSKADMCMQKIGPIKTKVPCVTTWPGNPIKNKLGSQSFSIDIPFGLKLSEGGTAAELVPGEARMNLGGQYVEITKAILGTFQIDLNSKLSDAIRKAVDRKTVTAAIPKEYLDAGLSFSKASFVAMDENSLGLDVYGDLKVTKQAAKTAAKLLYEEAKKKLGF
ncbi:hypothetical protein [Bradyrhizobium sp. RT3a]|uniref:hypothetical protein n=1 Tax=unclassified Bradyrhizobium TaxID=2631580 RepID=UPI003395BDCA